jgi:hypothetical protein
MLPLICNPSNTIIDTNLKKTACARHSLNYRQLSAIDIFWYLLGHIEQLEDYLYGLFVFFYM